MVRSRPDVSEKRAMRLRPADFLLLLASLCLALPASAQLFDSPVYQARAAKLERDLRARLLKPAERPAPAQAKPAAEAGMALARERKFAEALPLLERAIVHGGGDHATWLHYANALAGKRPAELELALDAAHHAWSKSPDAKTKALALYHLGFWHEQLRHPDEAIAAYEESLKLEQNTTVKNRLAATVAQYRHQVMNAAAETESTQPRICLTFSKPLVTGDPAVFAQYIAITPPIRSEFDAKDKTLCISGVSFGQSYRVTVRADLPSTTPLRTTREETFTVAVPDRTPSVAFRGRAYILPKASRQGIPLASVNVDRAKVRVLRINERNLVHEINSGRIRELLYEHTADRIEKTSGQQVWSGTLRIRNEKNREVATALPFREMVADPRPGIYVVLARPADAVGQESDEERWDEWATQWVVVTDLGASTYSGPNGLSVFVRSYESAEPRGGVIVRLLARNNEILGTAVSDASGRADFAPGLLRGQGGVRAAAITLETAAGEFAFLDLVRPAFDLTDRGVGGREAPHAADAFVYTERGAYRPGETVHVTALLRDLNGEASLDAPLILKVVRPDGVEAQRLTVQGAGAGGYGASIALASSAPTGAWKVETYLDPRGRPVGSAAFQVEDFVPERMEMSLVPETRVVEPGKPANVKVEGRFLYGAPAAELALDAEVIVKLDREPFPEHKGFRFGLEQESFEPQRVEVPSTTTDEKGQAALALTLETDLASSRPLAAELRVTLNEEGGRSIERLVSLPIQLKPVHLGLRLEGQEPGSVAEGASARFQVIAVDRSGRRVAVNGANFALVREVHDYQWYNQDGRWNYRSVLRDEPVEKGVLSVSTGRPAEVSFTTPPGRYRFELTDPSTGATSSYRYSVGWSHSGDEGDEAPDKLAVRLDKTAYKAGETARLSLQAPFDGFVHYVIASDRILLSRHEPISAGQKSIEITVERSWGTGVYVLATAYRPNGKAEKLGPTRAIGLAYLARDTADRALNVRIEAAEAVAPRRKSEIKVAVDGAAGQPVFLTLAAVDEGILALTGYATPAPGAHFFGKRKLGLELRDDYGRLIDAYAARLGEIRQGGDDRARHLGGLDISSIQTVALFSGIVRTNEAGEATVPLEIPDFNGKLRLMAVAWTGGKTGNAERALLVRDPVVSTVTLPRFLAPGDRGRVTVVLHNVSAAPGAYRVRLLSSGAAVTQAPGEAVVRLAANERERLAFTIAGAQPGAAALQLAITGPQNFALQRSFALPVRSTQPSATRFLSRQIDRRGAFALSARDVPEFLPGTTSLYLTVGTAPDLGVADLLQALEVYPYGCAEQTTSRALPLLYLAEVARSIGVAKNETQLRDRVQQAIQRVLAMQQRDGGFGLWGAFDDGGGWLTAYIMDFLTQARSRGYVVPDLAFESGINRLDALVRDLSPDEASLPVLAYAHYVLAANKRGDVAAVRYLHDSQLAEIGTALGKAQLAAALAQFGDTVRAKSAFDAAKAHGTRPAPAGRAWHAQLRDYGSLLRDRAGVLHLASLAQPGDSGLEPLIEAVRAGRRDAHLLSTQEQVWMLLAAHGLSARGAEFKVRIAGRDISGEGRPFSARYGAIALSQPFVVQNTGEEKVWVSATVSGIPARDQPREEKGFEITRAYYTLKGERADLAKLRQSDVLVALVRVNAKSDRPHQALIVDLLPAGFEIENPRLERRDPEEMKWLPKLATPRATEPRDDRFVAAIDLAAGEREIYLAYVVRAVTPGTFRVPAAHVEDMYAPSFFGRDAMGTTTILPRQ
jgi:uncharacterized protein YfaS (alpha-2-macroglobulin family)